MTTPVQPSKAEQFTLGVGPRFQHVSSYGPGGLNELDLSNVMRLEFLASVACY
jgi:hypothetical protein